MTYKQADNFKWIRLCDNPECGKKAIKVIDEMWYCEKCYNERMKNE